LMSANSKVTVLRPPSAALATTSSRGMMDAAQRYGGYVASQDIGL
jgi:hypothetical protein